MTIDEMRKRKTELGYSYKELSALTGLPLGTLQKVLGGITERPRRETIEKLERILGTGYHFHGVPEFLLCDSGRPVYNRQKEYTVDDYYALPDDCRAELIDGVFYDMATPAVQHQVAAGEIYFQLLSFQKKKKTRCFPYISPISVQLDRDNKTMVEPDVVILCDPSKLIKRCIYGAPDLVVEILSPSTRKKDMSLKLKKYTDAGVREYWLVDTDRKQVVVYDLEHEDLPVIYTFTDDIPVLVWGRECRVNLREIIPEIDAIPDGPPAEKDKIQN